MENYARHEKRYNETVSVYVNRPAMDMLMANQQLLKIFNTPGAKKKRNNNWKKIK